MSRQANVPSAPVQARIVVPGSEDRAFEIFTARFTEWWPLATHSVYGKDAQSCVFEARPGGRIYERTADGREATWGEVLEVSEPGSVRFSWHPGRDAETAQEVTVQFQAMMFGTTVSLQHGNWEKAGENHKDLRSRYERDWPGVLGAFAAVASKS
jgi:uncharacterized protein YndB with AHSA1/START domain